MLPEWVGLLKAVQAGWGSGELVVRLALVRRPKELEMVRDTVLAHRGAGASAEALVELANVGRMVSSRAEAGLWLTLLNQ